MAEESKTEKTLRPMFAAYPLTAISGVKLGAAVTTILVSSIEYAYNISMSEKLVGAIQEIMVSICVVLFLFLYEWIRRYFKNRGSSVFDDAGMTLIELMVVVGIISILAAIAIPQFNRYRKTAFDAAAKSDVKNAAIAEEAYSINNGNYTDSLDALKQQAGFRQSSGVTMKIVVAGQDVTIMATSPGKCAAGTGEWTYSTRVNQIEGEPCR